MYIARVMSTLTVLERDSRVQTLIAHVESLLQETVSVVLVSVAVHVVY